MAAHHRNRCAARCRHVRCDVPRPSDHRLPTFDHAVLLRSRHTAVLPDHRRTHAVLPRIIFRADRADHRCHADPRPQLRPGRRNRHRCNPDAGRHHCALRRRALDRRRDAPSRHWRNRRADRPEPCASRMELGQGRPTDGSGHHRVNLPDHRALQGYYRTPVHPVRRADRLRCSNPPERG